MTEPPQSPDRPTSGYPYQPPGPPPGPPPGHPTPEYPTPGYPTPEYPTPGYPHRPAQPYDPYGPGPVADPRYGPPADGWRAGYPGANQPGGYPPPPPRPDLVERLGARLLRRPEPRLSIVAGGAGAALLLLGALIWAGSYYLEGLHFGFDQDGLGADGGNSRRFLGAVLFLGIAVAGYAAAIVHRRGAIATAGAVAAAGGVPLTLVFLTLDARDLFRGEYPFNLDAVFLLSILVWSIDYFFVPGLRGRTLFVGAAAIYLFSYIAFKAAGTETVLRSTSSLFGGSNGGGDTGAVTGAGLVFGLAYYAVAAVLDSRGRHGAAVALAVAGFYATVTGVIAGAEDMGQAGTGTLLVFLGAGLAWYGTSFGRRFTSWAWGAGFALGLVLVVVRIFRDSYPAAGITLIVVGLVIIAAGYAVATATREAPDVVEVPAPAR